MNKEKAKNRKPVMLTDSELALFEEAMKRDGMSALTTWMKSICTKYATGQLTPKPVDMNYLQSMKDIYAVIEKNGLPDLSKMEPAGEPLTGDDIDVDEDDPVPPNS